MACTPMGSVAPAHHPAAQGESLLGSATSLFLLKSSDHLFCSQVLNGVTRPIPQLGFSISKRNSSISIPFLVFWNQLCCDCSVRVHVWLSGVLSCRIQGLLQEQMSRSSPETYPGVPKALEQHPGGLICGGFLCSSLCTFRNLSEWVRFLLASLSPSSDARGCSFSAT